MSHNDLVITFYDPILITGASGFIGSKVVETLLASGYKNLRCFVRPSSNLTTLKQMVGSFENSKIDLIEGNLLSPEDCARASDGVSVIFHLAAGMEKTFPGSFMNSVVTTRNLLESTLQQKNFKRFVNVSSFAVYSNFNTKRGGILDESCEVESELVERYEPYVFAKVKQDQLVTQYAKQNNIPCVIVRPAPVYGPGKAEITSRVGIDTFGIFLHLGGSNTIPLTYVDNCAEAVVLAGLKRGVDGEIFNIVDDELPTSRKFLKMYKKNVRHFKSLNIPYAAFYMFCYLWEKYSNWSKGQLPPVFNRRRCSAYWKGNQYSNEKLKSLLGWRPRVGFDEASKRYFEYLKNGRKSP